MTIEIDEYHCTDTSELHEILDAKNTTTLDIKIKMSASIESGKPVIVTTDYQGIFGVIEKSKLEKLLGQEIEGNDFVKIPMG